MQTVCLFGSDYENPRDVHKALKTLLSFPEYYGMNADALNDCLGELVSCPALWVRTEGSPEVRNALELIARVFLNNGGIVKEL